MPTLKKLFFRAGLPLLAISLLAGCSAVGTINALTPNHPGSVHDGIAFGALARQKLDVYLPVAAAPPGGWPVVVFYYGGSWAHGNRADYKFVGEALASRGMVALVADYRVYPEVRYPDFLADCALAAAWGLEHAKSLGGDPKRVFLMGHSAGGYNAAMLALDPRWLGATGHAPRELAGWIGLAGAYDFFPTDDTDAQPVFFHPDYPAHAQPPEFVRASSPPTFVASAVNDRIVSPQRSTVQLADKLRAAGAPVTLELYGGLTTHTTLIGAFAWPLRWIAPVLDDVTAFVETTPAAR